MKEWPSRGLVFQRSEIHNGGIDIWPIVQIERIMKMPEAPESDGSMRTVTSEQLIKKTIECRNQLSFTEIFTGDRLNRGLSQFVYRRLEQS